MATACVAPKPPVCSRLNATGSTATIVQRARDAGTLESHSCRCHRAPITTTVSPGIAPHRCGTADPYPVVSTTPDQRRLVQRCPLVDFDQRRLGDHGILRTCPAGTSGRRPTRGMETVKSRRSGVPSASAAPKSHMFPSPRAIGTVPTRRQERQDHRIALGDVLDTRTHFDHGAGTSWPPTTGSGMGRSPVTRCSSEWYNPVAVSWTSTSSGLEDPTDVPDFPLSPRAPQHRSTCLHMCLLNVSVSVAVD